MFQSHVISWNLTRRCNLECAHCYIAAGRIGREEAEGELTTDECLGVVDQIAAASPEALLILTGGEPLLRKDVFEIAAHADSRKLWVVVGTNGVLLSDTLCERMTTSGIRGVALSLDSLDPEVHDRFRGVRGAWRNTVEGSAVVGRAGLPFIVQTTVGRHNLPDVEAIARRACELGARVFNLYFLTPTGRGAYVGDITPSEYDGVLARLMAIQREFQGRMLVNAKCAPHYQRILFEQEPESPFRKVFASGAGGCPAGTHYLGIRPNGDVTPCPYLPVYGGNLRQTSFQEIWDRSPLFVTIRTRAALGGKCGPCEFNAACGGCRARAYGATGDWMAEDPWCTYQPGAHGGKPIPVPDGTTTYGLPDEARLEWSPDAEARLGNVPSFVRGYVRKRVEEYARARDIHRIDAALMQRVREELMPRIANAPSFLRRS